MDKNENFNFTFINDLDSEGDSEHVYTVGVNRDEGIARLFCPSQSVDKAGVQTYTSSQQLAEFGMLCFALAPLGDIDSIGELIDGLLGEGERLALAKRLRELADNLEEE